MEQNSKNQLQEYFQKERLSLPKYKTLRNGGNDHQALWTSTVILHDNNEYQSDETQSFTNKISAENSAAKNALSKILPNNLIIDLDNLIINKIIVKTALCVDIENLPKFIDELPKHELSNDNLTIYAFIGEHHCLIDKIYSKNVIKIVSPSTRTDGTDTCMQIYIGMLLAKEVYETYLIATRDHYGAALVELISSPNIGWINKTAHLVTKPCHIYS